MKTLITLIIALLLILLATQMENYLGQQHIGQVADADRDRIDYYLADFSIMATAADGSVSYNLAGRHLSHWQGQKHSLIINPLLQTADGFKLQTAQLEYDQTKREISTDAEVFITHPSGAMQSVGLTAKLDEGILRLNSHVRANYQAH
jgi:lipopolysaccharide export system protein LptC